MIKLNGAELIFKTFPNGETHVDGGQINNLGRGNPTLLFKYENDSDLIKLMLVKCHLDSIGSVAHLKIMYMPYSRMDRVEGDSVFTLKYISNFINSLKFESVLVFDPHSNVTLALLDRCTAIYPSIEMIDSVAKVVDFDINEDYLFYPDAGCQARCKSVKGYKTLVGYKERDFKTGQINKLDLVGSINKTGFKVIIVDDLCSYGGTFIMSAEKLKEVGASEIYLLVGHTEYSIYKGKILETDLINKVFTTNSILEKSEHEKIHVFIIGGY